MKDTMYQRILVTGGSAVAGYGLQSVVKNNEYPGREFLFPASKELNLLDFASAMAYVENFRPDAIIHFAAISGGIQLTIDHPASVMRDNVLMNFNIIEAARLSKTSKLLMTLSGGMYPLKAQIPIKEESIHEGYPHESNYGYAFAKRLIDPMIKAYRKEYGMDVVGIVPDALLGPRSNFNPNASTAIPALIRRFYENLEGNVPLVVWGDGSPLRQVTFSEDIGRIAVWCVDNYSDQQILNVGTAEEISIKDAAYTIAECMDIDKARITFDFSKPAGQYRKTMDNSRFVSLSRFTYTPIREAIRKTVEYFIAHYPNPGKVRL